MILLTIGICIFFVFVTWVYMYTPIQKVGAPPLVPSYIPWFGNSFEFYKNPVQFIVECQKKYGNIFTIYIGGIYFTYIMDPDEMKTFFMTTREKTVSFDDAVVEFVCRVFNVPRSMFFDFHKDLITLVRGSMSTGFLQETSQNLSKDLENVLGEWKDEGQGELFNTLYKIVFRSNLKYLIGKNYLKVLDSGDMMRKFHDVDSMFEIAASGLVPEFLLRSFASGKRYFLDMFSNSLNSDIDEKGIFSQLNERLGHDDPSIPSWGLAILWAAQANSLPATYWAVTDVLKHPHVLYDSYF